MDRDQIILAIQQKGCSSAVFADAQLRVREILVKGEQEAEKLGWASLQGLFLGGASFAGALSVSSLMAPITLVAVGGTIAWAIGEYLTKTKPGVEQARELHELLSDATPEEWAVLAKICGDPEDLMDCWRAGFVANTAHSSVKGTQYHAALVHAHGLRKGMPAEFVEPVKTGFGAPKSQHSWRDAPKDEPESDPTNAETALVYKLCNDRAGVRAVADKILSLRDVNRQAALNLAITHAGISDRDYVKAGIALPRLRAIKKWAADGDKIKVLPPAVETVPIVAVEVIEEVEAVTVEVMSLVEVVTVPIFDAELEADEIIPVPIASPTFQRIKKPSLSIWDSTDLETIEPADIGNVNQFPIVLVVAGQGNGKTVTLGYIFECLSGNKAVFTPKVDDHRNPSIQSIYDLKFGYNAVSGRGSWFGNQESFLNSPMMDLDWYLDSASNKNGSALDFLHAANQTAVNRTAVGMRKNRSLWRVFYDEAAQTYVSGFSNTTGTDGVSLGRKGELDCQWFISSNLKPAIFNWRGAGVQLFIGCQSETVENIGLKGCAEARDEAWHLYPGPKAIEIAKKHKQSKLASFLQRALSDGYAIAILEKEGQQFKVIRMPKLADLARFDPIIEDESPSVALPAIEAENLEDRWDDDELNELATARSVGTESIDDVALRIMAMTNLTLDTRLKLIEDAHRG